MRQPHHRLLAPATLMAASLAGGVAHALPPAFSYEYFGLNDAINIQTSTAIGVLNYTGGPGCGGICTASSALGGNPSVSINVNEVSYNNTEGGYVAADLSYYVALNNAVSGQSYNVIMTAHDAFGGNYAAGQGVADGQAYIALGTTSAGTQTFASYVYQGDDCFVRCAIGEGPFSSPQPFGPTPVVMIGGVTYLLTIQDYIGAWPTGGQLTASIDPTFSTTAPGVGFIFSPGVTSGAPEPGTWAMMLVGLGGAGGALRSARRRSFGRAAVPTAG